VKTISFKIKTDRLMTLLPLPPNCVALEELPSECPEKVSDVASVLMELLGSLQVKFFRINFSTH
jgi:PX domain-containing protein kinase-like protein